MLPALGHGGARGHTGDFPIDLADEGPGRWARSLEGFPPPSSIPRSSLDEMRLRMDGLRAGAYRLVYVAPERFRNQRFMAAFPPVNVSLLAVDEAHCISQWGHDFRPDYLRLRKVVDRFPDARVMALTATATPDVRADVIVQLGLDQAPRQDPAVLIYGFARPNLHPGRHPVRHPYRQASAHRPDPPVVSDWGHLLLHPQTNRTRLPDAQDAPARTVCITMPA